MLIVDDWNWLGPRLGTTRALRVHRAMEIRTTLDNTPRPAFGPHGDWHNGYFVAVLEKPH